jgi:hypothetical protein
LETNIVFHKKHRKKQNCMSSEVGRFPHFLDDGESSTGGVLLVNDSDANKALAVGYVTEVLLCMLR